MAMFHTFLPFKPCSKETKDFYFGTFVKKTQISAGNLIQLIIDKPYTI